MSTMEDRVNRRVSLLGKVLGQWQSPAADLDMSKRWMLQRFDETKGVFRDMSTTDSAVEADRTFRQGPEWRVLDSAARDIAAEYVPYRVGHVVPPLTFRDALWQAEYSPRSRFAQEIEVEAVQLSAPDSEIENKAGGMRP